MASSPNSNPNANPVSNPFAGGLLQAYQNDTQGNLSQLDTKGNGGVDLVGASYILDSNDQPRRPLLINLLNETSLRGLKPQDDGSNRNSAPYVYRGLPEDASPLEKAAIEAAKYSYDFPIRGGALSLVNSVEDTVRIGKFLLDSPKGPLFITKQVLLQLSNPKIETGQVGGLENTRIYNLGLNTLAQVPVNAFGVHLDRSGLLFNIPTSEKYYSIVSKKRTEDNRLVVLANQKIVFDPTFLSRAKNLGISTVSNHQIMDYWGGPDSTFGILGRTTTNRSVDTGDSAFKYDGTKESVINTISEREEYSSYYPYYSFLNSTYAGLRDNSKGKIKEDFRAIINREVANGRKVRPESDYVSGDAKTVANTGNGISLSPLIRINNDTEFVDITTGQKDYLDQIKFAFETIDTVNPLNPILMLFRAYLTSFTDNVSADWQSSQYTGRGENFWTYRTFNNSYNFGFKVAAESSAELQPLYTKLNFLKSCLAPVYDTIFMSGPLMRVTIGDYLYRQPGFFSSLTISIDENTPWETNLEQDKNMYQLPHVLSVEASFTPVHQFLVRRYASAPFITPAGTKNRWLQDPIQRYGQIVPVQSISPNTTNIQIPVQEPDFNIRTSPSVFPNNLPGTDTINNPFNNFG